MPPKLKCLLAGFAIAALLVPAAASAVPPQEVDENGNSTNDTTVEVEDENGDTVVIDTRANTSPTAVPTRSRAGSPCATPRSTVS